MTSDPSSNNPDKYPSEEEIPDDPVAVDDIDPFKVDDEDFEDIDDFSAAEWKNQSTADERIRTVINRKTTPKSPTYISDKALVSETKARKTLKKLAEEGIIRCHQTNSRKLYSRKSS